MAKVEKKAREREEQQELIEKLVSVRRVCKVVKGGKRFAFSALVVVGDGKGRVGYGNAKAREVPDAVRKAIEQAKKAMVRIHLKDGRTLHHDAIGHFSSARVAMRSAPQGTGIIAGSAMRSIFEALGIHDVVAKSLGSSNPYNMVKATFDGLNNIHAPRVVAAKLGKKISDIMARRGVNTDEQKED